MQSSYCLELMIFQKRLDAPGAVPKSESLPQPWKILGEMHCYRFSQIIFLVETPSLLIGMLRNCTWKKFLLSFLAILRPVKAVRFFVQWGWESDSGAETVTLQPWCNLFWQDLCKNISCNGRRQLCLTRNMPSVVSAGGNQNTPDVGQDTGSGREGTFPQAKSSVTR